MNSKRFTKVIHECYIRLYKNSDPSVDYENLLYLSDKPYGFELKTGIPFLLYSINVKTYNKILKEIIKEFKLPKYYERSLEITIALGASPKFK